MNNHPGAENRHLNSVRKIVPLGNIVEMYTFNQY